jgi:LCP family protein required for cell wall assembly
MGKHRRVRSYDTVAAQLRRFSLLLGLTGFILVAISGWSAWSAYRDIERVAFGDAVEAAEQLATIPAAEVEELREAEDDLEEPAQLAALAELEQDVLADLEESRAEFELGPAEVIDFPYVSSPRLPDEMFTSFLLVGVEGGFRADAIILVLIPQDGSPLMMTSLPRDLYLPNPCTQRYTRINAGLVGCKGYASGPELLSLMVADFTGIEIDHFVRIDFGGFQRVVDALGGVEICVENPVRDAKAFLALPGGCSQANGSQALAWVRSRRTEELVDGTWQKVAGVSDFTRQRKQQDMLFKIAGKLNSFASFASFSEVAQSLADTVALDEGFSFGDALSLAWSFRGLQSSDVLRVGVTTQNYVTSGGAWVLLPTASYNERLAMYYPAAQR